MQINQKIINRVLVSRRSSQIYILKLGKNKIKSIHTKLRGTQRSNQDSKQQLSKRKYLTNKFNNKKEWGNKKEWIQGK